MPSRTIQVTRVGKRKIELSNLTKVLFPDDHIVKAQLIEYYFKIAPTILAHVKGRPLSLLRYPDGIGGESFFQKNRPYWAPDWIEHVLLGNEQIDYILATDEASLVWIANLACIELHQMPSRAPHFDRPDYVVYDLDPPENLKFTQVAEFALKLKEHLEKSGYHPFVKTTGRKGLHVLTPIETKYEFSETFEAAKAVAQPFVNSHASSLTLHIRKELRKGKILLDIYRNRRSQTIVSPYSLRGIPEAPVSIPLHWNELASVKSSQEFNLQNVPERLMKRGDPWEAIGAYATPLHTHTKSRVSRVPLPRRSSPSRTHKTPEQLEEYSRKRRFDKTSEPSSYEVAGQGNAFVVHRHHATRLHYDLRLEKDGVLSSWAIPKGLPPRPGMMRLAVKVEDHPLEYANFEGVIPKKVYGGGMMWIFARGRYEITKQKKNGFYFRLQSPELNAEYRIHHTKESQWLLERVDTPQIDWLQGPIAPMMARTANKPPNSKDYLFEVKWDGIRAIASLDEGAITIRGRNGYDITKQFPELAVPEKAFRAECGLFDGEIVCLDPEGKPEFERVIHRLQQRTANAIDRARAKDFAVFYAFDCLYLDGRPIVNEPLTRRREWLKDAVRKDGPYRVSEVVEEGPLFFEAAKNLGLEGVMAKLRGSKYEPGKRSETWLKVKVRQTLECAILGYTQGAGDRASSFGALHLGRQEGDRLEYVGKVGTGFNDRSLGAISAQLRKLKNIRKPITKKLVDDARSIWVEPRLACEVQFASLTKDGMLREPVFVRLRPDLRLT